MLATKIHVSKIKSHLGACAPVRGCAVFVNIAPGDGEGGGAERRSQRQWEKYCNSRLRQFTHAR